MFKRTSRVIAIVMTLCMVFTMNSAVFATTANTASDNTFTYVTLGASQTNGYGMRGYLDAEVYQNPDKFDKDTANVFGYERAPEAAYPSLIAKQMEKQTGKNVELRQLAMSSMRAEEVRMLLDESYNGDDYTAWRFSAGHNWFDRAGGVDKLRADYKDAVKKADLVTVEVGVNNFGVYAINQIISGGKKFETDLADIAAPDKMETYNMIKGMIKPMISDAVGVDEATVELLADTFSYAYVGYKTSFDAIIAKIRELNPDTQIVVLGIPNMLAGVEAEMNGATLPLGDLFGYVVDLGNMYASTESPYLNEYLFASTGEAATFLEEAANYNGDPASLSINMKDCFDVYDDDLRLRSKVTAAFGGDTTSAKYSKALNNAYDVAATVCQAAAKNNVINLEAMLADDFGDAEDKAMAYIEKNIEAAITAAKNGKAFNFKFDNSLMNDPAVATAFSMGIRANFGNSFFAHPSEIGHQEVADAILEAIDFETTGPEAAAAEMSSMMNDIMGFMLSASPAMFDSQAQIVNKLKKAVNNLDSYAKAQVDNYVDVKAAYAGKGLDAEIKTVEKELNEMRKAVKDAKSAIGTLAIAVNNANIKGIETASATVNTKMVAVDAGAAEIDAAVRAAAKKARELGVDNKALKGVASEMSSYAALAYATTGIMKSDSRELAYAPVAGSLDPKDSNNYNPDASYYVALGDASTTAKNKSNAYGRKLIKDFADVYGANVNYNKNFSNEGLDGLRVDDLLYILDENYEPDAYSKAEFSSEAADRDELIAKIEKADLITVGFSNNTLLDIAIGQMMKAFGGTATYEIDWSRYLDEASAAEIETMMTGIEATLAEATAGMSIPGMNMANIGAAGRAAIENYLYGYMGFYMNYQTAMNKIAEINPDAKIVLVGMYNAFEGANLVMDEEKLPMGEYMGMLTDLMNLQQRGFAMMTGKATYVEAPDVEMIEDAFVGDLQITGFVALLMKGIGDLSPSSNGHAYIKDQILAAMNVVDVQTEAVIGQLTGLYDMLNISSAQLSEVDYQIKEARKAYDALTATQKAKVDAELVQLLEFFEADYEYVKVAAVGNSSVTNLKAKFPVKTKLTVSWTGVTGAKNYVVKIYRNGALLKTTTTTAKSVSLTNIYRGCTYKATVQPVGVYNEVKYPGLIKTVTVTSKLDKANITAKKSGTNVKVSSKDQNSTGFQVWVSTSKTFKKNVTKKTFKTSGNALKNKAVALKKGTNYVKVRAYTTFNGKTTYGAWSAVKTVKR